MLIVITGTAGTGKTLAAKELARILRLPLIDVKKVVEKKRLYTLDKYKEMVVDPKKLRKAVLPEIKRKGMNVIIENHLLCEFPLPADYVFVLRCRPDVLEKRLGKRKYREQKVRDNLMAEMLDYCIVASSVNYRVHPIELDTTRLTAKQTARKIAETIRNKKKKLDRVDYTGYLKKHLGLR